MTRLRQVPRQEGARVDSLATNDFFSYAGGMRCATLLALGLLSFGCETDIEKSAAVPRPQDVKAPSVQSARAPGALSGSAATSASAPEAPGLRRGYGSKEAKLAPCLKLESDRVIRGGKCTTNFMVFGQYVHAPPNSDVELRFEVDAQTKIYLSSDIVSGMGTKLHAGFNEQIIEAGAKRWIGYRVHIFSDTTLLEGRIHVRSDEPASFAINDLSLTVR
jgi:hypothetical protein